MTSADLAAGKGWLPVRGNDTKIDFRQLRRPEINRSHGPA
jgi:hypothetical protein